MLLQKNLTKMENYEGVVALDKQYVNNVAESEVADNKLH